jgi:hypothetical protein
MAQQKDCILDIFLELGLFHMGGLLDQVNGLKQHNFYTICELWRPDSGGDYHREATDSQYRSWGDQDDDVAMTQGCWDKELRL